MQEHYKLVQKWTVFAQVQPVLIDDELIIIPDRDGAFAYWKRRSSSRAFELDSSFNVPAGPIMTEGSWTRTAANRNFFVHPRPAAEVNGIQAGEVDIYTKNGRTWVLTKTLRDDSVETKHFGVYTSLSRTFLAVGDQPNLNANIVFYAHDADGNILKDSVLLPPLDGTMTNSFWVNESRLFRLSEYGPPSRVRLDTYNRNPVSRTWDHEAVYDPPAGTIIGKTLFGAVDRGDRIYILGWAPDWFHPVVCVATLTTTGWTTAAQIVLDAATPGYSIAAADGILFIGSYKSLLLYKEVRINDWRLVDQIRHTPLLPEATSHIEMVACRNRILVFAANDWDNRNPAEPRFLGKVVYCYEQSYQN